MRGKSLLGTPRPAGEDRPDQLPVHVPKAAELIADVIRRQIVVGELKEGEPLPAESKLMAQFRVSRPTLREAFRILETDALIHVRRGAGGGARARFPQDSTAARSFGMLLQIRGATLGEVLQARTIIEPPMVGQLALSRTAEDLAMLKAHIELESRSLEDFEKFGLATARLHELLVKRADNTVLGLMVGMLDDLFLRHVTKFVGRARPDQLALNRRALSNHIHMVERVEAYDAIGAEAGWRRHMELLYEIIMSELGETTVLDLY
ncbi:MAG TPA: GntR family transcriptional regulator [Rhizomicrobium sp.]|nr:GntR family transcriptional regulator [Rhizomicrobium sp.]